MTTITQRHRDRGAGNALRQPTPRTELTSVGWDSRPMGERLRRHPHPVDHVGGATDIPRKVRLLGEDFLFRDPHHGGCSRAWLRAVLLAARHPTRGLPTVNRPNIVAHRLCLLQLDDRAAADGLAWQDEPAPPPQAAAAAITSGLAGRLHADARLHHNGRGVGGDPRSWSSVISGPIPPSRKPSCGHAGAGLGHHRPDRDLLWPGRRPARHRHGQRRAEERLQRRGRAPFPAFGGSDHRAGRADPTGTDVESVMSGTAGTELSRFDQANGRGMGMVYSRRALTSNSDRSLCRQEPRTSAPAKPCRAPCSASRDIHISPNTKPFWEPDETERKQIERIGSGNKGRPETPGRLT